MPLLLKKIKNYCQAGKFLNFYADIMTFQNVLERFAPEIKANTRPVQCNVITIVKVFSLSSVFVRHRTSARGKIKGSATAR